MSTGTTESSNDDRYWFTSADPSTLALLEAVRRHRAAEAEMRRRLRVDMDMGDTDVAALRWLIGEERAGRSSTSAGLARELGITTAATAKLVGRLVVAGDLTRTPHPTDRRVLVLQTLPGAHERIRQTLGRMHERMQRVAESFDPAQREVIIRFLDDLALAVAPVDVAPAEVAP